MRKELREEKGMVRITGTEISTKMKQTIIYKKWEKGRWGCHVRI
jgi:hypothetical protein